MNTAEEIIFECTALQELLLAKNAKYGDSAFNSGIMFNVPPITAIKARINDKISRIRNNENSWRGAEEDLEDCVKDLLGYLILLRIAEKRENINKI